MYLFIFLLIFIIWIILYIFITNNNIRDSNVQLINSKIITSNLDHMKVSISQLDFDGLQTSNNKSNTNKNIISFRNFDPRDDLEFIELYSQKHHMKLMRPFRSPVCYRASHTYYDTYI